MTESNNHRGTLHDYFVVPNEMRYHKKKQSTTIPLNFEIQTVKEFKDNLENLECQADCLQKYA